MSLNITINPIDALIVSTHKLYRRLGYCSPDTPTFNDLCDNADDELFNNWRFSGRTTYWMLCFHRHRPRRSDTTSDNDGISCSCPSIWLSCLTVVFWYACCTKTLTDFSFFFSLFILLFLFYIVMACVMSCFIKRRLIDWLISPKN